LVVKLEIGVEFLMMEQQKKNFGVWLK